MSETPDSQEKDVTLKSASELVETECEKKENDAILAENQEKTVSVKDVPQSKDEIVSALEALIVKSVDEVKDEVSQLKSAFYSIRKQEIEQEKAAFLEKGNEESAFAAMEDEKEIRLKELLAQYKEKRADYILSIENEKKENLNKKQDALNKMNEIIADTDNINRHYNKFQQLQQDFKLIGDVPPTEVTRLWKEYQQTTENFYDLLKINKDLRDYDFKKNLESKQALIELAKELDNESDIIIAFKKLQDLHNQWREIGPVAPELREDLWQSFKDSSTLINKKYQSFFESRKEREKENEDAKVALCEKIEAIDFNTIQNYSDWESATEKIKKLQEEWKNLGFAARKINIELFARFRKTCDSFFALKADFFKKMKEEASANLQKKIALCEKVESLKDSTDWKNTATELVALQKEWKTIGPVVKKHSDSVWNRFISACDYFFEQKEKQSENFHKTERANLEIKKGIITTLNGMLTESVENAPTEVRSLMAKWRDTGHVPFKEKDKIYTEYQTVLKQVYDKYDINEAKARIANFETSVNQLGSDSDKLYRERDKQIRIMEQKRNELKTYENNMTFFTAKSKSGNSLLKEMERKISKLKEDIDVIEKKVKLIESKIQ